MSEYDLIIIGGGPASFSAAIYAARYKLKTLLITKELGGYLNKIHLIENYPGFKEISGLELAQKFKDHINKYNIPIIEKEVIDIKKHNNHFLIITKDNKEFKTRTIILALGTEKRKLNLKNEDKFIGKGISYCYICDAPLTKDKLVAVVGGSDSAVRAASLLVKYAKKVYILYRKEKLRGEPLEVEKILKNPKVEFIKNVNIKELKGDNFLKSVILDNNKEINLDYLFIEIGSIPSTDLISKLKIKTHKEGFIIVDSKKKTSIPGIFAAGDITNTPLKQIITASADGAIAAHSSYEYLKNSL